MIGSSLMVLYSFFLLVHFLSMSGIVLFLSSINWIKLDRKVLLMNLQARIFFLFQKHRLFLRSLKNFLCVHFFQRSRIWVLLLLVLHLVLHEGFLIIPVLFLRSMLYKVLLRLLLVV